MKNSEDVIVERFCIFGSGLAGVKVGSKIAQEILLNCNAYSIPNSLILEFIGGVLMGAVGMVLGKKGSDALLNENGGGESDEQ